MTYTIVRTVPRDETLQYGHYYMVKTEVQNLTGEGFSRWTPDDWSDFRAKLQFEMSQNDLVLVDIEKITDYEANIITRYEGHSILALAIVIVIGAALTTFGLWIVRDNIVEIIRGTQPIAKSIAVVVLAIVGALIFFKVKG